jgi:WD40 repeat protein
MAPAENVRTFTGHTDAVACVKFSRDGAKIASGFNYQIVRIWTDSEDLDCSEVAEFALFKDSNWGMNIIVQCP